MTGNNFTEEDKQKVVEFLNIVAAHATFTLTTDEVIKYFKLIAHMQQVLLPKISENILEVKKIIEPKKSIRKKN